MSIAYTYRKMLDEATKKEAEEKFGKHLFGEFQDKEDDTKFEEKLWDILKDFIGGNYMNSVGVKSENTFKTLADFQKNFPKELQPKADFVYRGATIPYSDFVKLNFKVTSEGWEGAQGTYKPRGKVQSWSADEKIAKSFVKSNGYSDEASDMIDDIHLELVRIEDLRPKYDKLMSKEPPDSITKERIADIKWSLNDAEKGIKQAIRYLSKQEMRIGVIYELPVKKNEMVFNHEFSNKISRHILSKSESEVVRIGGPTKVMIWIPPSFANKWNKVKEMADELNIKLI